MKMTAKLQKQFQMKMQCQKMKAFLGLKRALLNECYEQCSYWVALAYHYGSSAREVAVLVRNPRLHPEEIAFTMDQIYLTREGVS